MRVVRECPSLLRCDISSNYTLSSFVVVVVVLVVVWIAYQYVE